MAVRGDARSETVGVTLLKTRLPAWWVYLPWSEQTWQTNSWKHIPCTFVFKKLAKSWESMMLCQQMVIGEHALPDMFTRTDFNSLGHLLLRPNMIIQANVSTLASIVIVNVWKMNDTSRLSLPWRSFLTIIHHLTTDVLQRHRRRSTCRLTIIQKLTSVW